MGALAGSVVSRTDYAVLGASMGSAGFTEAEVSNFLGLLERGVRDGSAKLARETALSLMPIVLNLIKEAKRGTALEIYHRIKGKTGGFGIISHSNCCQIALDVAGIKPGAAVNYLPQQPGA